MSRRGRDCEESEDEFLFPREGYSRGTLTGYNVIYTKATDSQGTQHHYNPARGLHIGAENPLPKVDHSDHYRVVEQKGGKSTRVKNKYVRSIPSYLRDQAEGARRAKSKRRRGRT